MKRGTQGSNYEDNMSKGSLAENDKVARLTDVVFRGLVGRRLVITKQVDELVRKEIKRILTKELRIGEEIDAIVRRKIQTLSSSPAEGAPAWTILYERFRKEQEAKRGRR